jgi:hypothetical protein
MTIDVLNAGYDADGCLSLVFSPRTNARPRPGCPLNEHLQPPDLRFLSLSTIYSWNGLIVWTTARVAF